MEGSVPFFLAQAVFVTAVLHTISEMIVDLVRSEHTKIIADYFMCERYSEYSTLRKAVYLLNRSGFDVKVVLVTLCLGYCLFSVFFWYVCTVGLETFEAWLRGVLRQMLNV